MHLAKCTSFWNLSKVNFFSISLNVHGSAKYSFVNSECQQLAASLPDFTKIIRTSSLSSKTKKKMAHTQNSQVLTSLWAGKKKRKNNNCLSDEVGPKTSQVAALVRFQMTGLIPSDRMIEQMTETMPYNSCYYTLVTNTVKNKNPKAGGFFVCK